MDTLQNSERTEKVNLKRHDVYLQVHIYKTFCISPLNAVANNTFSMQNKFLNVHVIPRGTVPLLRDLNFKLCFLSNVPVGRISL